MRMEAKQHRQDEGGSAKAVRLCQSGNADAAGIWDWVREEAERVAIDEPQLRPLLQDVVLSQPCLGASLGVRLARKLAREEGHRFLRDDGLLVGYLETEDFQAALAGMEAAEVNARWQKEMAPFFESLDGARPDEAMKPLTEVFHLA